MGRCANTEALRAEERKQDAIDRAQVLFEESVKVYLNTIEEAVFFIKKEAEEWDLKELADDLIKERV